MSEGLEQGDEILTVEQVAKLLKLKPQTVYKWAQEGQIPGAKLGKEWRFRRRIVDEWIDNQILLSRGGFNLLHQRTQLGLAQQNIGAEDIDRLMKELG